MKRYAVCYYNGKNTPQQGDDFEVGTTLETVEEAAYKIARRYRDSEVTIWSIDADVPGADWVHVATVMIISAEKKGA